MLTLRDEARSPYVLKSKCKIPNKVVRLHTGMLRSLATQHGCEFVKTQGSLVQLRNVGPRTCPIGGEINVTDNAFFLVCNRGGTIRYGCHNAECQGQTKVIHQFHSESAYEHYEDYAKILQMDAPTRADIESYLKSTVRLVERVHDPFYVTYSRNALASFDYRIQHTVVNQSKNLFKGSTALTIFEDGKPLRFANVLQSLQESRQIRTYRDAVWVPYNARHPQAATPSKLNLFTGFALESVPKSDIEFPKTRIYDLLSRLCGNKRAYLEYLLNFIATKLQRPQVKHPIALCFINSKEGSGKGSFGKFLELLFASDCNTYVSFNDLEAFKNSFNSVQAKAQWICLEEVSCRNGGLRSYNGFLKDKISSTVLLMEPKGKERVQVPWYGNVIIFSNEFNVMSCSRNDRRLVFFSSDSSKANDKSYFTRVYEELADLRVLKSAFDWFTNRDVSGFDYRAIPYSRIKEKLVRCSERNADKFHRYFLKQQHGDTHRLTGTDVYDAYRDYCSSYGISKVKNRHNVISTMELHLDFIQKTPNREDNIY